MFWKDFKNKVLLLASAYVLRFLLLPLCVPPTNTWSSTIPDVFPSLYLKCSKILGSFSDYTNGPLILRVHTNENSTGKGFHLEYSLRQCNISEMAPTVSSQGLNPTLPPSAATRSPINL